MLGFSTLVVDADFGVDAVCRISSSLPDYPICRQHLAGNTNGEGSSVQLTSSCFVKKCK
jgi:hypothetical protein